MSRMIRLWHEPELTFTVGVKQLNGVFHLSAGATKFHDVSLPRYRLLHRGQRHVFQNAARPSRNARQWSGCHETAESAARRVC